MAKRLLKSIPGVYWLYQILRSVYWLLRTRSFQFIRVDPPGHYYSPIPDYKSVLAGAPALFDQDADQCAGIALREKAQLDLMEVFSRYYDELPWSEVPSEAARYYYRNDFFRYADAIITYSLLRHYKPSRVVEVGSGFSSAAMLDVNDLFLEKAAHFTFVEPHPQRLLGLLRQEEQHIVLQQQVQHVPLRPFSALCENDVLFIDSSHVVKIGSDLQRIFFEILPALKPGVFVHFHDIFWPFEYPKEWFLKGRAWNEAYFLRSFLQFNDAFEIVYFNSYLAARYTGHLREKMPLCCKDPGGSLWLRKVA
jgi:hypothetical protein